MAKGKSRRRNISGTGSGLAIAAAIIAAALIWANTESVWITIASVAIVMLLVSGEMFRNLVDLSLTIVREVVRYMIASKRYTATMYAERMRTERERMKWQARLAVEQSRQEMFLIRTSATASQARLRQAHRLTATQDDPVEYDELSDVEYQLVER